MTIARVDDMVGNPHRAQIFQFELFELILLFNFDKQLPAEQFEAAVSQSTVPFPPRIIVVSIIIISIIIIALLVCIYIYIQKEREMYIYIYIYMFVCQYYYGYIIVDIGTLQIWQHIVYDYYYDDYCQQYYYVNIQQTVV